MVYRDKAVKYVNDFFKNLDHEDYFGYISLDENRRSSKDEIMLEKRGANELMKKRVLADIAKREIDYVFNQGSGESSKTTRLERALEQAYEWQNNLVPDEEKVVNGKVYVGPHKWIVCILGDDVYAVN